MSLRSATDSLHNGAICDLAESSTAIEFEAVPEAYGIAHAGTAGLVDYFSSPIDLVVLPFLFRSSVATNPYILTTPNDGVVETESASGNLSQLNPSTIVEHLKFHSREFSKVVELDPQFPPVWFGPNQGIAEDGVIARQVRDALDTPDGWEPLPMIGREASQVGVPVSGGRGEIDNVSWLNQCAPGGPLNRMGN